MYEQYITNVLLESKLVHAINPQVRRGLLRKCVEDDDNDNFPPDDRTRKRVHIDGSDDEMYC